MEAFLRFIFIIIIVYYVFKFSARYIIPWVITRFIKKQQDKFNNMNGFNNTNNNSNGEVHIKTKNNQNNNQKSKNDNNFGEYVDFEDIE